MKEPVRDVHDYAIQHGENLHSYTIIRPIKASNKWTSYLGKDETGKRVTLTYIDRERIIESYQVIAFQNGTPIEQAKLSAQQYVHDFEKTLIDKVERIKDLGNDHVAATYGYSFDKERDQLVIVTEYTPGVDLGYASERLNPKQLIYLFAQVLDGLAFIHQNGFLHLNIKPSRVYVDFEPDVPAVKLTDFGFAIPIQKHGAEYSGTLLFMAPEVALNQPERIDARADLFSFGVLMYNCLTGRYPYEHRLDARSQKERIVAIIQNESSLTIPPSHYNREIPKELDTIVLNLLQKEPEKRCYESTDDLVNAFYEQWPEETRTIPRLGTSTLTSFEL